MLMEYSDIFWSVECIWNKSELINMTSIQASQKVHLVFSKPHLYFSSWSCLCLLPPFRANVWKICSLLCARPILYIVRLFVCAWVEWGGVIKGSRACLSSLRAGSSHVKLLPQDTVIVKAKLQEPRFHLHWWNKHQGWISVLIKSPLCVKRQQR